MTNATAPLFYKAKKFVKGCLEILYYLVSHMIQERKGLYYTVTR